MSTGPSRRGVLLGAAGALACRTPLPPPPIVGTLVGREQPERGHRVSTAAGPAVDDGAVDVVIVGAGVAGLSAAWRLARAGFAGTVELLELGDTAGGTAIAGPERFPWGAHYVTLPNASCRHFRALLAELGVIESFDTDGRPRYRETDLCFAPQERLFDGAEWVEGLLPSDRLSADERAEVEAFEAECARWSARVGADGLAAFDIPVHRSSLDPEIRALAHQSFADWLDAQGFRSAPVRWLTRYATRDDYGAEPAAVSAWAGLHYHCARRPDPAVRDLGTHVLTWPEGNGWLVARLLERVRWPIRTGSVVRRVEPDGDGARVVVERPDGGLVQRRAKAVILAIPTRVAGHLLPLGPEVPVPDLAPWRVAAVHVDRLPASRGLRFAWDSVAYDGRGLGYVSNAHQTGAFRGPAVLTWYDPPSDLAPAAARRGMLEARWEDERDRVLADLSLGHPDLRSVVRRVDVRHWGHGTAIPAPGLHADLRLLQSSRPHPGVWLAHADRSGLSLFEEASFHGVRAAEQALGHLGFPVGDALIDA